MSRLSVRLFGRLSVQRHGEVVPGLNASKVQELFCYLLLHRDRPHPREALASLLWGDTPTAQSKKYLRQSLWQLQGALKCHVEPAASRTLLIDSDWVQLNSAAQLWLDVADFEQAALLGRGAPSENLDAGALRTLQTAVELYQGHLLEGWYQEWCMGERERLQSIYLAMLDKLMGYFGICQRVRAHRGAGGNHGLARCCEAPGCQDGNFERVGPRVPTVQLCDFNASGRDMEAYRTSFFGGSAFWA